MRQPRSSPALTAWHRAGVFYELRALAVWIVTPLVVVRASHLEARSARRHRALRFFLHEVTVHRVRDNGHALRLEAALASPSRAVQRRQLEIARVTFRRHDNARYATEAPCDGNRVAAGVTLASPKKPLPSVRDVVADGHPARPLSPHVIDCMSAFPRACRRANVTARRLQGIQAPAGRANTEGAPSTHREKASRSRVTLRAFRRRTSRKRTTTHIRRVVTRAVRAAPPCRTAWCDTRRGQQQVPASRAA